MSYKKFSSIGPCDFASLPKVMEELHKQGWNVVTVQSIGFAKQSNLAIGQPQAVAVYGLIISTDNPIAEDPKIVITDENKNN